MAWFRLETAGMKTFADSGRCRQIIEATAPSPITWAN